MTYRPLSVNVSNKGTPHTPFPGISPSPTRPGLPPEANAVGKRVRPPACPYRREPEPACTVGEHPQEPCQGHRRAGRPDQPGTGVERHTPAARRWKAAMYMKVFLHGQGRGDGPTHYLVCQDYPGRDEQPPEVLHRDVDTTHALIDLLDTKWKFTACVLSWHLDDKVTAEQEQRVMDEFEQVAFAGLEPDQRNILWVRHSHAGHHELHFVIPHMELSSGRAFNPCLPVVKSTLTCSVTCTTTGKAGPDQTTWPTPDCIHQNMPTCIRPVYSVGAKHQARTNVQRPNKLSTTTCGNASSREA